MLINLYWRSVCTKIYSSCLFLFPGWQSFFLDKLVTNLNLYLYHTPFTNTYSSNDERWWLILLINHYEFVVFLVIFHSAVDAYLTFWHLYLYKVNIYFIESCGLNLACYTSEKLTDELLWIPFNKNDLIL